MGYGSQADAMDKDDMHGVPDKITLLLQARGLKPEGLQKGFSSLVSGFYCRLRY